MKASRLSITARYDGANLECARIIAADPIKYPGGAQQWAAAVLKRLEQPADVEAAPLFAELMAK